MADKKDNKKLDDDEVEEVAEGGAKKGNMMKMIIIINAVVVVLLIGVVTAVFLLKDGDTSQDTEVLATDEPQAEVAAEEEDEDTKQKKVAIYIPLTPAFVVNFENQDQEVAFLQVEIEVMTYDPKVEEALKMHNPRIRNELLLLLGGQQYHDINTPDGKRKLAQDALQSIQTVLEDAGEASAIESVLFTSFVMQ